MIYVVDHKQPIMGYHTVNDVMSSGYFSETARLVDSSLFITHTLHKTTSIGTALLHDKPNFLDQFKSQVFFCG